ncbi:MAG: 4-(cytidine 5'-diphospho)-2-C-methyl-D-erythritol kinase [Nitrospirae bacterium]|nr:4-(cytidine 5'-diphospho)-2-C-methyl-D-erythritol kinase [Nitrospirota bacterium]
MKTSSLVTKPALSLTKGHSSLSLKAPAKINWFLCVLGLRDDGFHEIQSLIQKITLYDTLTFKSAGDLSLTTSRGIGAIPTEQNLVYKAAMLLKKECGVKRGAHINMEKHIPMCAGLGGGSSDAAATIIGLNKLWGLNLSRANTHAIAQKLGSDVPFFLNGSFAFVEGRGEKITKLKTLTSFNILLVKPMAEISTAWAYKNLPVHFHSTRLTKSNQEVDNIKLSIDFLTASNLSNDLEAVAIKRFPVIADIKNRLVEEGAIFSMMSGSGPTVFGVFNSEIEASKASLAFNGLWTAVVQTITKED